MLDQDLVNSNDLIIYPNRKETIASMRFCLLAVGLGIFAFIKPDLAARMLHMSYNSSLGNIFVHFLVYVGIPFFGFGILYELDLLFNKKPTIAIDKKGVFLRSFGLIPWENISKAEITTGRLNLTGRKPRMKFLIVRIKNYKDCLGVGFVKRSILRLTGTKKTVAVLQQIQLPVPLEEALKRIEFFLGV